MRRAPQPHRAHHRAIHPRFGPWPGRRPRRAPPRPTGPTPVHLEARSMPPPRHRPPSSGRAGRLAGRDPNAGWLPYVLWASTRYGPVARPPAGRRARCDPTSRLRADRCGCIGRPSCSAHPAGPPPPGGSSTRHLPAATSGSFIQLSTKLGRTASACRHDASKSSHRHASWWPADRVHRVRPSHVRTRRAASPPSGSTYRWSSVATAAPFSPRFGATRGAVPGRGPGSRRGSDRGCRREHGRRQDHHVPATPGPAQRRAGRWHKSRRNHRHRPSPTPDCDSAATASCTTWS